MSRNFEIKLGAFSSQVWQNEDLSYSFTLPCNEVKTVKYFSGIGENLQNIVDELTMEDDRLKRDLADPLKNAYKRGYKDAMKKACELFEKYEKERDEL